MEIRKMNAGGQSVTLAHNATSLWKLRPGECCVGGERVYECVRDIIK